MRAHAQIEFLETRRLLSDSTGASSVVIGDTLFYAQEGGLWKSDLDGSNAVSLRAGNPSFRPTWLTNCNGTLVFAANIEHGYNNELWRSDGTPEGTVLIEDLHHYGASSSPHDFMWVNGHLLFQASNEAWYQTLWVTDGTAAGTQRISPNPPNNYNTDPRNMQIVGNALYFEQFDYPSYQSLRFKTDGTVSGTVRAPGGVIQNGKLRIFGTDLADNIQLSSSNGKITVSGAGAGTQVFAKSDLAGIEIFSLAGDDRIILDASIIADATIVGGAGNDTVQGGGGDDDITGNTDAESIHGGAGNDRIYANGTINGGAGDDSIRGLGVLSGGDGNDTITSTEGPDIFLYSASGATIDGGNGDDILSGPAARMRGGAGNDRLTGSVWDDSLNGGSGADTLDGSAGVDTVVSDADDTILVLPAAVLLHNTLYISGTDDDDLIAMSLEGDSTLRVVLNESVFEFGRADVQVAHFRSGAGDDRISIDAAITFATFIFAGDGNDTILGGAGNDWVLDGAGEDLISAGAGGNDISWSPGNDTILGGAEGDRLNYRNSPAGINKPDGRRQIHVGASEVDIYSGIEGIIGSELADTIIIDTADDQVRYLSGEGGDDTLTVHSHIGDSSSSFYSGAGADTITGSEKDSFHTDSQDTVIREDQTPLPQPGEAKPSADSDPAPVVALAAGVLHITGTDGDDQFILRRRVSKAGMIEIALNGIRSSYRFSQIKLIVIDALDGNDSIKFEDSLGSARFATRINGDAGDDVIYGSINADRINGGGGNDWISAGAGNDTLYGDAGDDRIFGGDGRDYINAGGGVNVLRSGGGVDRIFAHLATDNLKDNRGDSFVDLLL